ncbi:hypothetical protein LB531_20905 [Mesorhizobium sp. CO1-1-2]|uniref:hypothetical protein n=1 Tax=Mesorhizobium sp. CO1-1-2 TaxID=2876635 RepID=UPI001CCFBE58|nr:hypothetical protein [Mesorhizobium sp. CO1-1-2]MBZ9683121.1 hypothetical protein [Mesorhizobium sp. CO1-1-2]
MNTPSQTSAYFSRLRTSAEFATAIDELTGKMLEAQKRKADLVIAEDAAFFGQGDLETVQTDLRACNTEIETLERQIDGAQRRRQEAAATERLSEIDQVGKDAQAKAKVLADHLHRAYERIEALRSDLFEADALTVSLTAANNTLDAAGRHDLKINVTTVRREAMSGPRAPVPARLSRKGLVADKMLQSFLSLGGVLDRRATTGGNAATGDLVEMKGMAHHAFQSGG